MTDYPHTKPKHVSDLDAAVFLQAIKQHLRSGDMSDDMFARKLMGILLMFWRARNVSPAEALRCGETILVENDALRGAE